MCTTMLSFSTIAPFQVVEKGVFEHFALGASNERDGSEVVYV